MSTRRRYRIVDDATREDAIATVLKFMDAGDSFTAACRAVSAQIDVSFSAVRTWVNDSGQRAQQPTWEEVERLRRELAAATELYQRAIARTGQQCIGAVE
ncbi:hypothetical protein FEZ60_25015 [Rhodococcus sp. MS16]|uniref:hypothetical protein n=1 Tax=Rhodococcus sp. MS16 TaxID=2579941 RepID=UPI001561E911|nr:hypothetical protein [Rhodococcus sp. MS16]NRI68785.1 hypothetical protein [Rhodococcus sp. MS16]